MMRGGQAVACRAAHEVWVAWSGPGARRLRRALREPEAAQGRILEALLRRNADSAYGRAHAFASIRGAEAYRQRVPVVGYEELTPWIERIRRGERGVLTRGRVRRLVPSSGSASAFKLIPWTRESAREWSRALQPWIHDLFRRHPQLKGGPAYWSVSPAFPADVEESAVPVGFEEDSAYLGGLLGPLVRSTLAVPEEVARVEEVEVFRYLTVLGLLREADLRLVSVWHPSFFTLLLDAMERHWSRLVRDVARGTVTPPGPALRGLPPALRRRLRGWLRPAPGRARALESVGPAGYGGIWPRLGLVSCWADGASAGAARALQRRLPGVPLQAKGLLATEGVVTVPFGGARPVAVRSHFLEFLDDGGRALTVGELRDGATYAVVLSTGGGLYRYRLGDRVQVEGFLEKTPCLRFLGREDRLCDLCGEKLNGAFVAGVLEGLFGSRPPSFAMLAPDSGEGPPGYTLYLEWEGSLPSRLAERLDDALSANPHYRHARRLGQLRPPALFRVAAGGHAAFLEREAGPGRRMGAVKATTLSTRADWSRYLRGAYEPPERLQLPGSEPLPHHPDGLPGRP